MFDRIVAVVGCQRSGTTLLGQLLGAHPDAALVDEFEGLYPWFHAYAAGLDTHEALAQTMLARASEKYEDPASRFHIEADRATLAPHVRTLVLKAPNLTFDDAAFRALRVPVTVVYPVRDPRAVVASMADLGHIDFVGNQMRLMRERPTISLRYRDDLAALEDEHAPSWIRRATIWRIKSGRAPAFERPHSPVVTLRYEDLVADTRARMRSLFETCGLEPSERALSARDTYVGFGPGGTDRTRSTDAASLSTWRAKLDPAQQRDILREAGALARQHDYV